MKSCSDCQKSYEASFTFCPQCGARLAEVRAAGASERSQQETLPIVKGRKQSFLNILTIFPPREPFQAQRAIQLMAKLSMIPHLELQILADSQGITWAVVVPHFAVEPVKKSIYASYPTAQIEVQPKTTNHIGYWRYPLEANQPFVAPLKRATDFRQDPLLGLFEMMSGLGPNERVVYTLALASPTQNYAQIGEMLITEPVFDNSGFSQEVVRVDKYSPDIQEVYWEKLGRPQVEAKLIIKIKAATEGRAEEIFVSLLLGLEPLANEPFNRLEPADADTFPLILCPEEVLWHLPSQACQTPGIVWAEESTAFYEVLGLPAEHYTEELPKMDPIENHMTWEELKVSFFGGLRDDIGLSGQDGR